MDIKHVKPGDVLKVRRNNQGDKEIYFDNRWKVVKVYRKVVLARSMKHPQIRRCFSIGDLVMMGLEGQEMIRRFSNYEDYEENE